MDLRPGNVDALKGNRLHTPALIPSRVNVPSPSPGPGRLQAPPGRSATATVLGPVHPQALVLPAMIIASLNLINLIVTPSIK